MASVSSLSSASSSSSIYGNRTYNIISGLASGLDTEELISGAVQGYQQKIQNLQKQNTKLQWQQEAYQSISDKLVEFYRNYSSFVYSNTNLASSSFFNKAVSITANGTNAALVTASGKTSSTVVLNAVRQLATAARYTHSASGLNANAEVNDQTGKIEVSGNNPVDLDGEMTLSKLAGSLTLNYGTRTVSIDFSDTEVYADKDGKLDAAAYKSAIEKKLSEQKISTSSGSVVKANTLIGVDVTADGKVSFYDKSSAQNSVSIAGASGNLAGMIAGLDSTVSAKSSTFQLDSVQVTEKTDVAGYLAGKSFTVTLDGKSKTITLPSSLSTDSEKFIEDINTQLSNAFGANKVTVDLDKFKADGKLVFQVGTGSTLSITASDDGVGKALGIDSGLTSYVDTTKTLGDLNILKPDGSNAKWDWNDASGVKVKGTGTITAQKDESGAITGYVDANGHAVDEDGYLIDENKQHLLGYDLVINNVKIGTYTKETELNTVINNINNNTEAGVNVSYSKTTGQFVFTAKDTGAGGRIEIKDGLGASLFGAIDPSTISDQNPNTNYTAGVDAKFNATINGQTMELTRSSNSFDLDGMNITISGTFNKDVSAEDIEGGKLSTADTVTFTSKTDADTIVEVVKKMVDDLNAIIKEVKSAYSDMPLKKSDGSRYEPLSDEDMEDMSDSAIKTYEEKAKTGILFMDNDLSSLYNDLRNAITSSGADGVTLRSIGIDTSYSSGLTTLTFNEQTFREALESDPDKVQQAFTKSKENGAATNGLMATLTAITDKYADTDGDVKGILIEKAGSQYSPTAALDNDMLDQMKEIEDQISKWQDKMSNQVDYYTNKFTQLELLINQMNSQSSALAGLLGG